MSEEQRWVKQWHVPSDSDPTKNYTVSLRPDGQYVCHCWPYLRTRQECKHIRRVLNNEIPEIGKELPSEPPIVLSNVRGVIPVMDGSGERIIEVQSPLVPLGNDHFLLTVLYDLLCAGVSWATLRERYHLPETLKRTVIEAYIQQRGRMIYGPWEEGRGYVGYQVVPV